MKIVGISHRLRVDARPAALPDGARYGRVELSVTTNVAKALISGS
jgi:hypothetical protein